MKKIVSVMLSVMLLAFCLVNGDFLVGEKEDKNCFLCGRNEESLMSLYRGRDSLGILCTDIFAISDIFTGQREGTGGRKQKKGNVTRFVMWDKGHGSVMIEGGETGATVSIELEEGDVFCPDKLAGKLCGRCAEKFLCLQASAGEALKDVFLVDLKTAEVYSLSEDGNFWVGRYRVSVSITPERIELNCSY